MNAADRRVAGRPKGSPYSCRRIISGRTHKWWGSTDLGSGLRRDDEQCFFHGTHILSVLPAFLTVYPPNFDSQTILVEPGSQEVVKPGFSQGFKVSFGIAIQCQRACEFGAPGRHSCGHAVPPSGFILNVKQHRPSQMFHPMIPRLALIKGSDRDPSLRRLLPLPSQMPNFAIGSRFHR
jgi:hypothetical protein